MKQCSRCGRILENSAFHRDQKSKSGLASACKQCKKERRIKYYKNNPVTGVLWDKQHPEKANDRKSKYRERTVDEGE